MVRRSVVFVDPVTGEVTKTYLEVRGPDDPPRCPHCGRVMSNREAAEQGACNDCHPGGAYSPEANDRDL